MTGYLPCADARFAAHVGDCSGIGVTCRAGWPPCVKRRAWRRLSPRGSTGGQQNVWAGPTQAATRVTRRRGRSVPRRELDRHSSRPPWRPRRTPLRVPPRAPPAWRFSATPPVPRPAHAVRHRSTPSPPLTTAGRSDSLPSRDGSWRCQQCAPAGVITCLRDAGPTLDRIGEDLVDLLEIGSDSVMSRAVAVSVRCPGRRAPTMATCTAGWQASRPQPLRKGDVALLREFLQLLHDGQVAVEGRAGEVGAVAAPIVGVQSRGLSQPPGQQPVRQRPVHEHADVMGRRVRRTVSSICRRNRWYGGCTVCTGPNWLNVCIWSAS